MNKNFLGAFNWKKPIIGILHLKGSTDEGVFKIAKQEVDTYYDNGADAVLAENYFGTCHHMIPVSEYLQENYKDHIYGVNCLYQNILILELATKYKAHLVQIGAIAGSLIEHEDISFAEFVKLYRSRYPGYVIGGIRFKHAPYLSGKSLEEDLKIAMTRCDAIAVSQGETGQEISMKKIQEFRDIIDDLPLIVGAGLTAESRTKQFTIADGDIVGNWVKDTHIATGTVGEKNVQKLIAARDALVKGE